MKLAVILYIIFFSCFICLAQTGYPEPKKTETRLFYIQHSNNHNTYVYDVNLIGDKIDKLKPIDEYRIIYTENGIKKPLTGLQEKMAYGMTHVDTKQDVLTFQLAATNNLNFYLTQTEPKKYQIYVTVNKRKMYLDKLFVKLKDRFFGSGIQVEYVLFYGTDYNSEKPVTEKWVMN